MYYSLKYLTREANYFAMIGKSALYSKKNINIILETEGRFIADISNNFLGSQAKRFPYGVIKDFLSVYPKLEKSSRYKIEKEFLISSLDKEGYLVGATEAEISLFFEYYTEGYNIGGKTALTDIKSALANGGTDMKKLGKQILPMFNLTDPVVRNKLKWEAGKRIVGINETTRRLIVNTLIGSYDKGEGYDGMKKDLKDLFESWKIPKTQQAFTNKRAEVIARTELGQCVSWAREISYRKRGVRKKSWLAEVNACPVCLLAMGDGVIGFNMTFSNGFSGPLAHPNCRCALLPEVEIQDYLDGYSWHGEAENAVHTQA